MDPKKQTSTEYWNARSHSIYLYAVTELVRGLGNDARSIIDIGSAACPYIDWFEWIPQRTSLDLRKPYTSPTVVGIKSDFLVWEPDHLYDIATCLQVLEHIPDARSFAQKILSISRIAIVSVPYKWKPGRNTSHVHDPVDEEKMRTWFEREPNFSYQITEIVSGSPRLIQVYERESTIRWKSLSKRLKLMETEAD